VSRRIPFENAFLAEVLRQRGWNTFWVGKNHNIPIDEWAMGGSKRNWPLARGLDRFYGFLGGETNQWYPDLTRWRRPSPSCAGPPRSSPRRAVPSDERVEVADRTASSGRRRDRRHTG
jgi:arylsulfatase A-like enzyme